MSDQGEETEWVRRCQQGDLEAFEALVRRYQRMIDSLAYRMSGSLHDAADISQEVFLQAYRRMEQFEQKSKFSSWLYRICLNTCLNWRQAASRRTRLQEQWAHESPAISCESPEAEDGELTNRIQAALLKLPARQRAAVILTTYDGLSHGEAAKVLGCSETTVSWRLFAARNKLKRLLSRTHGT